MPIRAITFDFWGTLYDDVGDMSERRERLRYRHALTFFQMLGADIDPARLKQVMDEAPNHAMHLWRHECRTMGKRELGEYVAEQMGYRLEANSAEALGEAMAMAGAQVPPALRVGASGVLDRFHGRYRLAVICDTGLTLGCALREVMKSDQVIDYFDHLTFSDETCTTKPMPRQFLYTCHSLGVPPEHTIHVGDLEETDIVGAREAGLRCVRVMNGQTDGKTAADATINLLEELVDVIEDWEDGA
ncbi:MAG: HAD family hydrolase [Phycisphaerae bacterium]|nr:HAD family hydrolase [Phycisphaerae bacterium]